MNINIYVGQHGASYRAGYNVQYTLYSMRKIVMLLLYTEESGKVMRLIESKRNFKTINVITTTIRYIETQLRF